MNLFICYEKCSTCKKAEKWLTDNKIEFQKRPIKKENPSYAEIKKWLKLSGLPVKRFFNTSGLLYKSMNLKDKLKDMSEDEQLKLLSTDGMLVKRPILIYASNEKASELAMDEKILVGFKEDEWKTVLKK